MTDQHYHRATPEQWAQEHTWAKHIANSDSSCIVELLHRVQLLEAAQHAHIEAKAAEAGARCAVEQMRSRPGSWQPLRVFTADEVAPIVAPTTEPTAEHPAQQFTAKYLFTACDILEDGFHYSQLDRNSVWFDIASDPPAPGDNIKIAHHWGGMPTNGVHSPTINYKVTSVSELENGVRRVRATRVDAQQLTLVKRVGCLVASFASEGLPGDDAVPTACDILRLVADYLRSDHPNHVGRGTDWADYFNAEADQ